MLRQFLVGFEVFLFTLKCYPFLALIYQYFIDHHYQELLIVLLPLFFLLVHSNLKNIEVYFYVSSPCLLKR